MSLKEQVVKSGMSKEEIAYKSGTPFDTLTKHLCGWRGIGTLAAERYAKLFGCSIETIMTGNCEVKEEPWKKKTKKSKH